MTPAARQVGQSVHRPPGDWLLRRVGHSGPIVLAGLACLYLLIPTAETWAGTVPLLVGLLIGLPHGAVDHLVPAWISAPARSLRITVGLLLAYAGTAAATVALFLWAPVPALTGFLILTVLHFGTGDVAYRAERDGQAPVRPVLAVLAHGGPPVVLPIALWPGTVDPLLDAVAPGAASAFAPAGRLIVLCVVLLAVVVTGLRELTARRGADVAALAILVAAFALVPPPLAFGGYFAAWHSARHVARLLRADPANRHHLAAGRLGGPARRFARQAILPTIAALAGLLVLVHVSASPTVGPATAGPSQETPFQLVFAVLAGLTVPHAAVVNRLDARMAARITGPVGRCPIRRAGSGYDPEWGERGRSHHRFALAAAEEMTTVTARNDREECPMPSTTMPMLETYPKSINLDRTKLAATIDALDDCAQACTACADACLSEDMVAELTKCVRTNLDCADICATTARVLSRHTGYDANISRTLLEACVTACKACGDECAAHADKHQHCRICADACRACERACRELLATIA